MSAADAPPGSALPRRLRLLDPGHLLASPLLRNLLQERFALRELVAGEQVGVYRIEREVGRGGMGLVYRAARADGEYEQTVALKWLPDSARDAASAARFRDERQILANLRHPGIARLIDGGRCIQGHLWFAMEYVDGAPLDEHCAAQALALPLRVQLLLAVLDAVAFAHARLLIHRDIKPRNVLVDADGQPRLLDFGIAALLGSTARPAYSPGFASPEQLACGEVGIASDIWQLGRLCRRVLEAGNTAAGRLPADLLAIVDKAVAAEPIQRYATVNELSADLQRFLAQRPVRARKAGLAHRARLLLRRHPWSIGLGGLAGFAFLATVVAFTAQLRRERDEAQRARATTQAVSDFITRDLLSAADPWAGGRSDVRLAAVVEAAVDKVDARFPQRAEVSGLLHLELGRLLSNLGRQKQAAHSLAQAVEELAGVRGPLDAAVLDARYQTAKVSQRELRLADVETRLRSLRADAVQAGNLLLQRRIDVDLAWNEAQQGDFATCHRHYLQLQQTDGEGDAQQQVVVFTGLSYCEQGLGQYSAAALHAQQGWALGRLRLGALHPQTLDMSWVLTMAQIGLGQFDAAVATGEQAYEGTRQVKGEQHSGVAAVAYQVGYAHLCAGRPREALDWLDRAVAIRLAVLAADDPRIAVARSQRAVALLQSEQVAAAQADMAQARGLLASPAAISAVARTVIVRNSALMHLALQENDQAAADFRAALATATRIYGAADTRVAVLRLGLGISQWRKGETQAGLAAIAQALPEVTRLPGCQSELIVQGRAALAQTAVVAALAGKRAQ